MDIGIYIPLPCGKRAYSPCTGEIHCYPKPKGMLNIWPTKPPYVFHSKDGKKYLYLLYAGKTFYIHRIAMELFGHFIYGMHVDHINGDSLDNRISNLRISSVEQNSHNIKSRGGTSIYRGVSKAKRSKDRWRMQFLCGEFRVTREFKSEIEAALAWDELARQHYGKFGRFNFPQDGELSALHQSSQENDHD